MISQRLKEMFNASPIAPADGEPASAEPIDDRRRRGDRKTAKDKTGERFKILNNFIDFTMKDLSRNEITVWMILYRDTKDGVSRTSIADLSRRSGISTRTGIRSIASLERKGLLKIVHRGGLRKGVSTYRICPLTTEGT